MKTQGALFLVGVGCLVFAAGLVSLPLGLAVLGASLMYTAAIIRGRP